MPELRNAKCKKCDHQFKFDPSADCITCPNCSSTWHRSRKGSRSSLTQPSTENAAVIPVAELAPEEPVAFPNASNLVTGSSLLEQITAASAPDGPVSQKPRRSRIGVLVVLCVILMASGTAMWWFVRKPTGSAKSAVDAKPTIAAVPKTETSTPKTKTRSKPTTTTEDDTPHETPRAEQPSEIELQQRITVLRTSLNQKQNELTDAKRELSSMVSR